MPDPDKKEMPISFEVFEGKEKIEDALQPPEWWAEQDLPEMPEIDHSRIWWTWNMALAWIIWRRMAPVQFVAERWDRADALADAFLSHDFRGKPRGYGYEDDEPELDHKANQALLDKIKGGAIVATGCPIEHGVTQLATTIEPHQWGHLEFCSDRTGREMLAYHDSSGGRVSAASNAVTGFLEPHVKAADIKKAFPADGKKQAKAEAILAAIEFLVEYLAQNSGRLAKREYHQLLGDNGIAIPVFAFDKKVWPEVIERTGRTDLTTAGPRGNR